MWAHGLTLLRKSMLGIPKQPVSSNGATVSIQWRADGSLPFSSSLLKLRLVSGTTINALSRLFLVGRFG